MGTREYIEYWWVSKPPSEVTVMLQLSWFLAPDSETMGSVGTVTHPARHSGSSDMGTESSMALQCLHRLKWGYGFAPIWTLKLDSSVHRTHLVSCTQMQRVMCPVLSQLTQIPTIDFKLSLRQLVQTCCLAPKSVNVVDMSPSRTFCVSSTPCHRLSVLLVPEMTVRYQSLLVFHQWAWRWMLLSDLPSMHIHIMYHSAVAFCNNQNHACHGFVLQLPSNLFKQHEAFITHMLYNRESFPLLWLFTLEHMKTC